MREPKDKKTGSVSGVASEVISDHNAWNDLDGWLEKKKKCKFGELCDTLRRPGAYCLKY
jgi:hypothetical protein